MTTQTALPSESNEKPDGLIARAINARAKAIVDAIVEECIEKHVRTKPRSLREARIVRKAIVAVDRIKGMANGR